MSVTTIVNATNRSIPKVTVTTARQGPPGPQGPGGPRADFELFNSTEILLDYRAIKVVDDQASYADATIIDDFGASVGISVPNSTDQIKVQTVGAIVNDDWDWFNGPVFVGPNGELVQFDEGIPIDFKFLQQIGQAVNYNKLIVNPQPGVLIDE